MSTSRPRRQRTPEEIEEAKAKAKAIMANQKKSDEFSKIKTGRTYIFVVAVVMALSGVVEYLMTDVIEVFYIYGPIIAIFVLLGIYFFRNPLVISSIALGLFITMHAVFIALDPVNLRRGLVIKILVVYALISAIRMSIKYRDELAKSKRDEKPDDILDEELIG